MLQFNFQIDGRTVRPEDIGDALMRAALESAEAQVRAKLQGIRDPDTGEFPVVSIEGESLSNLAFQVSGSPKLIALVQSALAEAETEEARVSSGDSRTPIAFLCHSSKNKDLVSRLDADFRRNGIDTFFDKWEIRSGDSIRQKLDQGLGQCTHFIVLLTPESIDAPWVKAEMDAAFVRKVEGACKFIVLRVGVSVDALPPTLRALHSPEIKDYETDVRALINDVHGITEKPPLGPAPSVLSTRSSTPTHLSAAAELLARTMIERSEHGEIGDPQLTGVEIKALAPDLTVDDIVDAVDELEGRGFVEKARAMGDGPYEFAYVFAKESLFAELDQHFMAWNPQEDALHIAAELVNGSDSTVQQLADKWGWKPRRINPAVNWLIRRDLVGYSKGLGTHPWTTHWISKTANTRRFVRSKT